MDDWYYKLFGDQFGPVTFEELVELAKSHSLSSDDEVRLGEAGVWRRAGSIGKLMAHLPYQARKKAISTAASPQDLNDGTSVEAVQNSSNSQWSNDDSFETAVIVEPAKVEERWWCKILDTEMGPMTFDELVDHAKNSTLSSDDEVRFGENGHWRRAGSIGPLMAHLPFQAGQRVISTSANPRATTSKENLTEQPMPVVVAPAAPVPQRPGKLSAETSVVVEPPKVAEPPKVDTRWWCKIQDLEYGPVDLPKVMEWVASGRLHDYDFVRVGLEPYVLAGELPGLFPPKPVSPSKEISVPPVIQRRPIEPAAPTKPVTDSAMSTLAETSPAITSNPERRPYTPAPSSMSGSGGFGGGFGAGNGGMNRPAVPAPAPVRRPAPAKSSINVGELLTGPVGLGAGGVVILALLYFFVLPLVMGSGASAADIKRFKSLQSAFKSLTDLRQKKDAKPEEFKEVAAKLEKAGSKVMSELKGAKSPKGKGAKKSPQQKLLTFATKLNELGKEDLSKPNSKEIDITTTMGAAATALGLK